MKVDRRGYLYLGKQFAEQEFELISNNGWVLSLERILKIPAKNAWFFDDEWQEGEKRAQEDIDKGKTKKIKDVKRYLSNIRKKKSTT